MQRNLSSCKRHISLPSVSTQSHLSTEAPHPLRRCCRTSQQPRHIQTTLWEEEEPQVISVDDAAPALPPRVSPWGRHAHFIWPRPCPRDSGSRSRASRFTLGAAHTPSPTGPASALREHRAGLQAPHRRPCHPPSRRILPSGCPGRALLLEMSNTERAGSSLRAARPPTLFCSRASRAAGRGSAGWAHAARRSLGSTESPEC